MRRWLALGGLCSVLLACGGDGHDPLTKRRPDRDGGAAAPGLGGTSAGGSTGEGGEGTSGSGGSSAGPGLGGEIDPNEVYFSGTLIEGNNSFGAIANVRDPNIAILGFSGRLAGMSVEFLGRELIYQEVVTDVMLLFTPDRISGAGALETYPQMADANDMVVSSPCVQGVNRMVRFMTGPDAKLVFECADGYYYDGELLPTGDGELYALGYDDLALSSDGILDLSDGSVIPIEGGAVGGLAARAYEGGFYAVSGGAEEPSLWDVTASGRATNLGTYPPLDGTDLPETARLGPDQSLYNLVVGEEIIRRTVDGDREIIYSEADDDPLVRTVPYQATIVTGP
jgi:hypothetical protein